MAITVNVPYFNDYTKFFSSIPQRSVWRKNEKVIYKGINKDEWTVRVAKTVDEASELMKVGFEYSGVEYDGFKLFRKHK